MDEVLTQDAIFRQVRLHFSKRGEGDFPEIANLPPHADAQQEYFTRLANHLTHLRQRCREIVELLDGMLLIADELDEHERRFDELAPSGSRTEPSGYAYNSLFDQKIRSRALVGALAETIIFKFAYISYAIEPSSGTVRCERELQKRIDIFEAMKNCPPPEMSAAEVQQELQLLDAKRREDRKAQKEFRKCRGKDLRQLLAPYIDKCLWDFIANKEDRHAIAHADEVIDLGENLRSISPITPFAEDREDVERIKSSVKKLEKACLYLDAGIHFVRKHFRRERRDD